MPPPFDNETAKIAERVRAYFRGRGYDLGCGSSPPIHEHAMGVDLEASPYRGMRHDLNTRLPIADGTADFVWSSHTLEHLADWQRALADWVRILGPHGLIGLYLPHDWYYDNLANPYHLHRFVGAEVASALVGLGCRILVFELDADAPPLRERAQGVVCNRYSFLIIAEKWLQKAP
jgi:SAM-dependent methyltransferase